MFGKKDLTTLGLIALAQVGLVICYWGLHPRVYQPDLASGFIEDVDYSSQTDAEQADASEAGKTEADEKADSAKQAEPPDAVVPAGYHPDKVTPPVPVDLPESIGHDNTIPEVDAPALPSNDSPVEISPVDNQPKNHATHSDASQKPEAFLSNPNANALPEPLPKPTISEQPPLPPVPLPEPPSTIETPDPTTKDAVPPLPPPDKLPSLPTNSQATPNPPVPKMNKSKNEMPTKSEKTPAAEQPSPLEALPPLPVPPEPIAPSPVRVPPAKVEQQLPNKAVIPTKVLQLVSNTAAVPSGPSPWKIRVEIVNRRTQLTARTDQGAEFRIQCDQLKLSRPGGNIEAIGDVLINGGNIHGQCDRLILSWNKDRLLLDGNAQLKSLRNGEFLELHGPQLQFQLRTKGSGLQRTIRAR